MENKKDYPQNHAEKKRNNAKMMEGVYAGPDFFAQRPQQMMQAVYGGPDFFAQQNPAMFQMAYAGPNPAPNAGAGGQYSSPQPADMKQKKWCHACGMTIDADAKFCSECGTPQPKEEA